MSSKEVKAGLKSAREAIKNKEFKEALKHCKAVLKLEKNNYNAWVFIGVAATELQQPDQAQTAYRKATELEPEQLLAWQGLANLYEKSDQADFKAELPKIYQKLITLYEIVWRRLIQVREREAEEGLEDSELLELWKEMTRLLQDTVEDQDNETQQHLILAFERALQMMVDVPSEVHKSLSQDYIKCLSKLPHEVAKLKEVCDATLSRYPTHPYPLEALSENYIRTDDCNEEAVCCFSRLSELDPNNSQAHFGLGIKACQDKKYEDAIKSISLGDVGNSDDWTHKLQKLKLEALVRTGREQDSNNIYFFKEVSYAHQGFFSLSHSFLEALSRSPDNGELFFLLGRLYWSMGDEMRRDRNKAHTHLLKAAKLDPYLGSVFRFLGHYYKEVAKDQGRARGCYKRAFELDSSDAEAGAATVDLSMEQGDMVSAALRADPLDWVCWECLGEAYLNRRSFIAALKAFDKAHALQPTSIYSLYQTAAIKQILGRFKEAAAEYRQISEQEDYVPALKGLGECLLALARNALDDYLDGRAVDLIQNAIHYLFRAVKQRPDLSCLWKLLGDACTTSRTVSPNRAKVLVPGALCGMDPPDQSHTLDQRQLLTLGERCFGRALKLMPEAPRLWCDLGLNYYHQSRLLNCLYPEDDAQSLLEKAMQCVKKAIKLDSANHTYWNTLGVVAMAKGIENFALAQHCFIKSVKAESNNVVAWTNLGALYLKKGNIELSHEALKIAQSLEPLYVNCWIGQAIIAETVGSFDTMDLFRHTTELSTHTEGVKGYAYWVCSTLLDKSNRDSELYLYNIVQMNAISAAQVALSKYTERIQTDPDAFIMLGYLNTHLQLKKQATEAYRRAVELLQASPHTDQLSFALRGYGRALSDDGQWEEAVRVYSSTPLEELHDLIGLALACFRIGRLPESVQSYEKALVVASSEKEKACILTALALIQHRLGSMDHAKTLLFKCSMLKEPVPESLQCLCALGLVHGDVTLASATLTELLKLGEPIGGAVEERCLLTCTLLALQGNFSGVHREAARAIHRYCIIFRDTVSLNFIQCDKATRTYHFYFCFNSFHLRRNALKTIQRAVLLCPGKLSYNQTCWISSQLMLSCWLGSKTQICILCPFNRLYTSLFLSQVLSVSPEHPVVFLMLRQVQCERLLLSEASNCVPPAVLDQLSAAVMANHTSVSAWHWLAEVYRSQGLLAQASVAYRKSLQLASQLGDHFGKMSSLLRLALLALMPCLAGVCVSEWKDLVLEASAEVLKMGSSPVALLYQALLQFSIKMGARETRRLLEKIVYASASGSSETIASVARWYLLRHLHTKDDLELIDTLLVKATAEGDSRLVDFHRRLYPSS
uniref:SKI3 subunit of superkiller complex n=1 Tax=Sinocyclocheilus grahami TaxID=75366 RepID=A0A672MCV1_SINGR